MMLSVQTLNSVQNLESRVHYFEYLLLAVALACEASAQFGVYGWQP